MRRAWSPSRPRTGRSEAAALAAVGPQHAVAPAEAAHGDHVAVDVAGVLVAHIGVDRPAAIGPDPYAVGLAGGGVEVGAAGIDGDDRPGVAHRLGVLGRYHRPPGPGAHRRRAADAAVVDL